MTHLCTSVTVCRTINLKLEYSKLDCIHVIVIVTCNFEDCILINLVCSSKFQHRTCVCFNNFKVSICKKMNLLVLAKFPRFSKNQG